MFEDKHFLQIHGTAMGTRMAPSYANIFIGDLERRILTQMDQRPDIWWRYIDDVFAIWSHGEERLIEFIKLINQVHPKIQFTAVWSNRSTAFLNVMVTIEEGRLTTYLITKPTNMHQYLHKYSCHPAHCKSTIAYSQALRLRQMCSDSDTYLRRTEEL